MDSITEGAALVAAAVQTNGEANQMLGVATTWLENEIEEQAAKFGSSSDLVGRLQGALEQAQEAQGAVSAAGAALESFAEALEACGE